MAFEHRGVVIVVLAGGLLFGCAPAAPARGPDGRAAAEDAAPSPDTDASLPDAAAERPLDGAAAATDATGRDAAADAANGSYRTSLGVCWTDASCRRALIVSHGGDWDLSAPYGSQSAFQRAFDNGADGVKVDLRITSDGVAVAAHSSPIELWESLECAGQRIEDMTAAQVTGCHMALSQDTFPRIDDVLAWARGRLIVMLTVKEPRDFTGAIAAATAAGAQDYVFFEIGIAEFSATIRTAPGWDQLHYLIKIDAPAQVAPLLAANEPQAFMFELDPSYANATEQQVADLIATQLRPAGLQALAASDTTFPTVDNHLARFDQGFDVVMSYNLANGVAARDQVNQTRGIPP